MARPCRCRWRRHEFNRQGTDRQRTNSSGSRINRPVAQPMLQDLVNQIGEVLAPFEAHFERYGYATYDSSDIYETALGRRAKRAWEKDSKTAFLYAAPLVILDILFPQSRRLFAEMKVQPICLAQVGLAYLRLAEVRQDSGDRYLALARRCFSDLKYCARATRSGIGWGLNINWSTKSGYMPPLTPCHSQTAYVFELIACLNRIPFGRVTRVLGTNRESHCLRLHRVRGTHGSLTSDRLFGHGHARGA